MALGEEKAELEVSADAKAQSCGRWSRGEQKVDVPGSMNQEQPQCLEAEGGPASPVWGAEGLPTPAGTCRAYLPQANAASRAAVRSRPAPSDLLPPASVGTGDLLHSVESQMEETKPSTSQELPQSVDMPRTTALCSGHEADTEDDPSPVGSPWVLSQQPQISRFPFPSPWKSVVSPGAAAPQLSSCSVSASSSGSSLQNQQEKVETQNGSLTKIPSSLELAVPQNPPSLVGSGPQLQWSSQSAASGYDAAGLGRRHLSFQAEYWACVLPDSLPPSPDRHSPLWNPNREYEDLLDYTYPLRPGPQLPKQLDSHVPADPVLQDSGIDLDSFSVSPASTLKSPTNVSPNCPPAQAPTLPFSGPREPSLKQWPSEVSQKQCSMSLASWSQLASTPKVPGSRDASWESRETALRGVKNRLPVGEHLEVGGSPQLRTRDRRCPSPRPEREKRACHSVRRPAYMESRWKSEEEVENDDEFLALPTRLTQVSSLVSYLDAIPTLVSLPSGVTEGQSSLEVSDTDGPASLPSDSSQSQLPSGTIVQGPGCPKGQNHCCLHNFVQARDSAGEGNLVSSRMLGVSSRLLKTHPSLPAVLDRWPFSDPDAERQDPRKEQRKASLVQCVQAFCCQLEELIRWLYDVSDVINLGSPSRSSLTGLKSSLQLYRQFKNDIDEHQFLTDSVLQKGEILLQCLLENTPVLKDVLGRIAKQSGELESHADRLYDSILASVDMLAGCTLIPDSKPVTAKERPCEGI
ncbi:Hypothetical predicted protein [Marmota monax]|uniref:Centrosomal protein of 68 kDa n=1 Tax=Marmota monax TaxID=9995 RepID=A0A5E4BGF1_MARMO|nr:Hypothetical predicted protein [Marmota monax]